MKFAYEDLHDTQFETLIVLICQHLLGVAVQGFATGPDGGRDAKFIGTAQLHPSTSSPWKGTAIIQAKHTNGFNRTFSDSDFFSPLSPNTVIAKETPRITKLRKSGELDHYMLFANRRLAGNADHAIKQHISTTCGVPVESLYLCGVEQLEIWLKRFKDVAANAGIDPVDSPLIVSPDNLAEVVQALAENKAAVANALDQPPAPRVSYDAKNTTNNMTADYAKLLRRTYLKEANEISQFLGAAENAAILRHYEATVEEFQAKIIAKRKDHQTFDAVMEYLLDLLFARDPILRKQGNKRLTRAVLFYMYWHCDIGNEDDAQTD